MSIEDFLKFVVPFIGAIGAVSGVYQWAAMRHRNKLKADLEILEKLKSFDKHAPDSKVHSFRLEPDPVTGSSYLASDPKKREPQSEPALKTPLFQDKIENIKRHIDHKLDEQYSPLKPEERYDADGSSFFIGLIILIATLALGLNQLSSEQTKKKQDVVGSKSLHIGAVKVTDSTIVIGLRKQEIITDAVKPTQTSNQADTEKPMFSCWQKWCILVSLVLFGGWMVFWKGLGRCIRFLANRKKKVSPLDITKPLVRLRIILGFASKKEAIKAIKAEQVPDAN